MALIFGEKILGLAFVCGAAGAGIGGQLVLDVLRESLPKPLTAQIWKQGTHGLAWVVAHPYIVSVCSLADIRPYYWVAPVRAAL
jgi:hypothetical protein